MKTFRLDFNDGGTATVFTNGNYLRVEVCHLRGGHISMSREEVEALAAALGAAARSIPYCENGDESDDC